MTTVMLCDDQDLFTQSLASALTSRGFDVVRSEADPEAVAEVIASEDDAAPDLCLLDLDLPRMSGAVDAVEAARRIRVQGAPTKVMLVSDDLGDDAWAAYDDRTVSGLVDKRCSFDALERVMWQVLAGERVVAGCSRPFAVRPLIDPLSLREYQVLCLIIDGASTEGMTTSLGISSNTVRTHVQSVLRKLGVHGRAKAAQRALELGLVNHQRTRILV